MIVSFKFKVYIRFVVFEEHISRFVCKIIKYLDNMILMGAHSEAESIGGHVLAPALEVSGRGDKFLWYGKCQFGTPHIHPSCLSQFLAMAIDSLKPGHGWPSSGHPPGCTDTFREYSAYCMGSW